MSQVPGMEVGLSWVLIGVFSSAQWWCAWHIGRLSVSAKRREGPTLARLWRAYCTPQDWNRRAELIRGNVGWLDNLKISLIMCKLPKRSIWCHCYTDGKDLTDVSLLTSLSSSIWPGATKRALGERVKIAFDTSLRILDHSEGAWETIKHTQSTTYQPWLGKFRLCSRGERRKFRHRALSGEASCFSLPEEWIWNLTTGVLHVNYYLTKEL